MQEKLFIPSKIKVGYQHRHDTYTKKLAYVIYYDEKGKLRKETSWQGWRDKTIPADDFENTPHSGFVLNKDVQRSSEWFGSGRNMIRVYDDRGIEFEITCDNLIFILMSCDCLKRGLQGEFVYAWRGKELILLPTDCEEYQISKKFTEFKNKKVSAKELIPGCSYKTKLLKDLIYLGKFDYYTFNRYNKTSNCENMFIFIDIDNNIIPLKNTSSLAEKNSDIPVSNYADLMDIYIKSEFSSPIENISFIPKYINLKDFSQSYVYAYEKINDNMFKKISMYKKMNYNYNNNQKETLEGFIVNEQELIKFDINNQKKLTFQFLPMQRDSFFMNKEKLYSLEELQQKNLVELYVIKQNGTKIKLD